MISYYLVELVEKKVELTYSYDQELPLGIICKLPLRDETTLGLIIGKSLNIPDGCLSIISPLFKVPKFLWNVICNVNRCLGTRRVDLIRTIIIKVYKLPSILNLLSINNLTESYDTWVLPINDKFELKQAELYDQLSMNDTCLITAYTGFGKTLVTLSYIIDFLNLNKGCVAMIILPEKVMVDLIITKLKAMTSLKLFTWDGSKTIRQFEKMLLEVINPENSSIVVGTRSTMLLPLPNVAICVVDECHDNSLFQEVKPWYSVYHGIRDLRIGTKVAMISATPLPSMLHDANAGLLRRFTVDKPMSNVTMIYHEGEFNISPKVVQLLKENVKAGYTSIVFFNHRGYSNRIVLSNGQLAKCNKCDKYLLFLENKSTWTCNGCGLTLPAGSSLITDDYFFSYQGVGIERCLEILRKNFSEEQLMWVSSDLSRTNIKEKVDKLRETKGLVILTTQIMIKGYHIEHVRSAFYLCSNYYSGHGLSVVQQLVQLRGRGDSLTAQVPIGMKGMIVNFLNAGSSYLTFLKELNLIKPLYVRAILISDKNQRSIVTMTLPKLKALLFYQKIRMISLRFCL